MRERSGVAHDRAVMPMRYGFADTFGPVAFPRLRRRSRHRAAALASGQRPHVRTRHAAPRALRISRHRFRSRGFRPFAQEVPELDGAAIRGGRARGLRLAAYRALHRGRRQVLRRGSRGNVVSLARAGHRRRARWRSGPGARRTSQDDRAHHGPVAKIADDGAHRSFAFDVSVRTLKDWDPSFELTAESLPLV